MQHDDSGGHGEPLVMFHAGVFADWFGPLDREPALAAYRRIRITRTGYADAAPEPPMSVADHAAEAAALLRGTGTGPARVYAHSSGCAFALQLALDHPDLVSGLVLTEPPLIPQLLPAEALAAVEPVLGPAIGVAMAAAGAGDLAAAYDAFLAPLCGPDHRAVVAGTLGREGLARAVRDSGSFFRHEIPALGGWAFDAAAAARITQPVLVAAGGASPPYWHALVEHLAGMLPAARTATIPGGDHLLPLTLPAAVAELVAATAPVPAR